jgi:hypothetical protein
MRSCTIPSFIQPSESFDSPNNPVPANGAPLSVLIRAGTPCSRMAASQIARTWLSTRGRWGLKLASAWNILGLLALLNVVTRVVLTAPGLLNLIHTEIPDRMIGTFPFLLIPGFFVPLAVVLHVLALRSIHGSLAKNSISDQERGFK